MAKRKSSYRYADFKNVSVELSSMYKYSLKTDSNVKFVLLVQALKVIKPMDMQLESNGKHGNEVTVNDIFRVFLGTNLSFGDSTAFHFALTKQVLLHMVRQGLERTFINPDISTVIILQLTRSRHSNLFAHHRFLIVLIQSITRSWQQSSPEV